MKTPISTSSAAAPLAIPVLVTHKGKRLCTGWMPLAVKPLRPYHPLSYHGAN